MTVSARRIFSLRSILDRSSTTYTRMRSVIIFTSLFLVAGLVAPSGTTARPEPLSSTDPSTPASQESQPEGAHGSHSSRAKLLKVSERVPSFGGLFLSGAQRDQQGHLVDSGRL